VFKSSPRCSYCMSSRGRFEVTFKTGAETGHVITEAMYTAIVSGDPVNALMILRRLVMSMPEKYRRAVWGKGGGVLQGLLRGA